MGKLDGRVALVTGASRGFGRAIARRFAAEGAKVAANYFRSEAEARKVVAEIEVAGGTARALPGDVTSFDDCKRLVRETVAAFGKLDVVVANAGAINHGPFMESTPEQWATEIGVNLWGMLYTVQAAVPELIRNGGGKVIVLSSQLAMAGGENLAVYTATKAAALGFARSLAKEIGRHNITVNAIGPGCIVTDMNRVLYASEEAVQARIAQIPLRRLGSPDDVAGAALYFASDDASFVTGGFIITNGGLIM